jgi:hypothetical protein
MQNAQAYESKQAAIRFAAEQLQKANPHLIAGQGPVTAAKNIRIELRRAFPGVKFTVNTKQYSGGNSINVRWIDGPTTAQVDDIIKAYSAGHFDGMTDCYEYRGDRAFTEAFGSAKYVFSERDYSDKMLERVIGRVVRWLGGVDRSVEQCVADWKAGNLWNVKTEGGCDLAREINVALSRHTCSIRKA